MRSSAAQEDPSLEALALDPLSLTDDLSAWAALAQKASDPNPFFAPEFLLPFLKHMGLKGIKLIVIRERTSRSWLMAAPAGNRRIGLAVPAATLWTTEFAPLGTPLLAPGTSKQAVNMFLQKLAQETGSPLVALPYLPLDTAVAAQLLTLAPMWNWKLAHEATRAGHCHGAKGEAQFNEAFSGKRRKELNRLMRRLSELGPTELTSQTGQTAVVAFDQFLELEASGWKGKAGTALKQDKKTLAFSREMIQTHADQNSVRIDSLCLSGEPIAMLVHLLEGTRIYAWKTAFDEAFSKYSPGSQLALYAMQENLKNPNIWGADSLAIPGHSMIEPLWRGEIRIATVLLAQSSTGKLLMSAGQTDKDLEQAAKALAKKLFRRKR